MKHIMCLILVVLLLTGCSQSEALPLTMDQIVQAYESQGYTVWTENLEGTADGSIGMVTAFHENENFVTFTFFDSDKSAKQYAKDMTDPVRDFISGILSEPTSATVEVYGNICLEYYDEAYCAPFRGLTGE